MGEKEGNIGSKEGLLVRLVLLQEQAGLHEPCSPMHPGPTHESAAELATVEDDAEDLHR